VLAVSQTRVFHNAAVSRNHFYLVMQRSQEIISILHQVSSFHWGHQNVEGDGMSMAHSRGKNHENYAS